jgi:hypothetical protein
LKLKHEHKLSRCLAACRWSCDSQKWGCKNIPLRVGEQVVRSYILEAKTKCTWISNNTWSYSHLIFRIYTWLYFCLRSPFHQTSINHFIFDVSEGKIEPHFDHSSNNYLGKVSYCLIINLLAIICIKKL